MNKYIGIMSGTSCDGIDICLTALDYKTNDLKYKIIDTAYYPYSLKLREEILKVTNNQSISSSHNFLNSFYNIHHKLGDIYADAVLKFSKRRKNLLKDVAAIGLHGQTVYHFSKYKNNRGVSIQLGEPIIVAAKTGVPVVYDFRARDIIFGGEGAPLAPVVDSLIFKHHPKPLALLNIGGISNVTLLDDKIVAFDTGPGNSLMDILANIYSKGEQKFDKNGSIAKRGHIIKPILKKWLEHPFFKRLPPKSTGRETFGLEFLNPYLKFPIPDLMRTALEFTSESIYNGIINGFKKVPKKVLVSGGGVHNSLLLESLRKCFQPIDVSPVDEMGIDPDFKEAFIFAVLAMLYIEDVPISLKNITGNKKSIRLGRLECPR